MSPFQPLTGTRLQDEQAFAKRYLDQISGHDVNYDDDLVTPPEKRPRKMPALSIPVADPPVMQPMDIDAGPSTSKGKDVITIVVKSLKPPLTYPVNASLTDSISTLKSSVHRSAPGAPSPEFQRLLLKGKALADAKLLKEYGIEEGAVINMVLKPGWDKAEEKDGAELGGDPTPRGEKIPTEPTPEPGAIPSLTISDADPSTTNTTSTTTFPARPLTTSDISLPPLGPGPATTSNTTGRFHSVVSDPEFWKKVQRLCREEFGVGGEEEADGCWGELLGGVRGKLSAGEIAKIQDVVGVTGMGGSRV